MEIPDSPARSYIKGEGDSLLLVLANHRLGTLWHLTLSVVIDVDHVLLVGPYLPTSKCPFEENHLELSPFCGGKAVPVVEIYATITTDIVYEA